MIHEPHYIDNERVRPIRIGLLQGSCHAPTFFRKRIFSLGYRTTSIHMHSISGRNKRHRKDHGMMKAAKSSESGLVNPNLALHRVRHAVYSTCDTSRYCCLHDAAFLAIHVPDG